MQRDVIPISKPWVGAEEEAAAAAVLRSGWLMQGPRVAELERAFAEWVGAPHAVACSSGTTALHLALAVLDIGARHEVVCPSLSFIATANAVVHAGARPRFADVDERTFNLDAAAVEQRLSGDTRAIVVAHQIGMPADLDALGELASRHGLALVEDAACAIGSSYRGRRIGAPHGRLATFSFHPRKLLTTGEGGMVTTADAQLAERLRSLRSHGARGDSFAEVGFNYRMTDLQAAIGLVQLGRIDQMLSRRRAQAERYRLLLDGIAGVEPPWVPAGLETNFQSYMIRLRGAGASGRDGVVAAMNAEGVMARPGIRPAHREPAYRGPAYHLPVSERVADETVLLPLYHELADAQQERVVAALKRAL